MTRVPPWHWQPDALPHRPPALCPPARSPLPTEPTRCQRCFIYWVSPWLREQQPPAGIPVRGCLRPGVPGSCPHAGAGSGTASPALLWRWQEAAASPSSPAAQHAACRPSASRPASPRARAGRRGRGPRVRAHTCAQGTAVSPCLGPSGGSGTLRTGCVGGAVHSLGVPGSSGCRQLEARMGAGHLNPAGGRQQGGDPASSTPCHAAHCPGHESWVPASTPGGRGGER